MKNISVTNVSEFGIRKIKIAKDKIIGGGDKDMQENNCQ